MTAGSALAVGNPYQSNTHKGNVNMADRPYFVNPGSMWLVVCECIFHVIEVSPDGVGFFIPGQEPCWSFDHIQGWVTEIKPPPMDVLTLDRR